MDPVDTPTRTPSAAPTRPAGSATRPPQPARPPQSARPPQPEQTTQVGRSSQAARPSQPEHTSPAGRPSRPARPPQPEQSSSAPGSAPADAPAADQSPAADLAAVVRVREWLATLDGVGAADAARIDVIAALETLKGAAAAAQARVTAALRDSCLAAAPATEVRSGSAARVVGSQVALARRESPTRGDQFLGLAHALTNGDLPHTMTALSSGVIGEYHASIICRETITLPVEHRREVDTRLAGHLGILGPRALAGAARRIAAELDPATIVARHTRAVRNRRVTVRPAPDAMAYLSILGPMNDIIGAYATLTRHAASVVAGQTPGEEPNGRTRAQVAVDTALRWLSGRHVGQTTPVEIQLVMTDTTLLGTNKPAGIRFMTAPDSVMTPDRWRATEPPQRGPNEPARIPGYGPIPAPLARAWTRGDTPGRPVDEPNLDNAAKVWIRRLFTTPNGRDLVAMDSHRRFFTGQLRRMLILRDDTCRTPWCEAPITAADHIHPASTSGPTTVTNGVGRCTRCNLTKEAPGWTETGPPGAPTRRPGSTDSPNTATGDTRGQAPPTRDPDGSTRDPNTCERAGSTLPRETGRIGPPPGDHDQGDDEQGDSGADGADGADPPHTITITTPTGHTYQSTAPPILGWGWSDCPRPELP